MYERIIVGTDGSDQAEHAVRSAGRLALLCGLEQLHVVTATRRFSAHEMAAIDAALPDEFRGLVSPTVDAQEHFDAAVKIVGPSLTVVPHRTDGHPADSILEVADQIDADLIVVGARGLGAVDRFLRGSVSTKVSHHAPCDVLVVEHHDR